MPLRPVPGRHSRTTTTAAERIGRSNSHEANHSWSLQSPDVCHQSASHEGRRRLLQCSFGDSLAAALLARPGGLWSGALVVSPEVSAARTRLLSAPSSCSAAGVRFPALRLHKCSRCSQVFFHRGFAPFRHQETSRQVLCLLAWNSMLLRWWALPRRSG